MVGCELSVLPVLSVLPSPGTKQLFPAIPNIPRQAQSSAIKLQK